MSVADFKVLHLRVAAEPDPGVLARVLERFQNLNVVPRRVLAEWATTGTLHVEVQVGGISEDMLSLIAAKLGQVPSILNAYWHR
jgi:hypothetical protein